MRMVTEGFAAGFVLTVTVTVAAAAVVVFVKFIEWAIGRILESARRPRKEDG